MPGLIVDKVGGGNLNIEIESNYQDLKNLKEGNKLVPGQKYLMVDYLHRYFIAGSNSDGIVTYKKITSYTYGYALINGGYNYDLYNGLEVIVEELPAGYTGAVKVGDVTSVTAVSSNYYFKFANGMHSITNLRFKFYETRYATIPEGVVINDDNGKPVMKPGGIINTEVHDGEAYMDAPASMNNKVMPEQIVLTAETVNSFFKDAESLTYKGDILEFDFDSNEVINYNQEVIGQRNGYIKRRKNNALQIDLPVDWRNAKYRRWLINEESRTQFLNQHHGTENTRLAYQGKYLFTSGGRKVNQPEYFYIVKSPEGTLPCLTKDAFTTEFDYTIEGAIRAKDFPVFPLDEEKNPTNVDLCIAEIFKNTVFQNYSGETSGNISFNVYDVYSCTFLSNPSFDDEKAMYNEVIAMDGFTGDSKSLRLNNAVLLSLVQFWDSANADLQKTIFGTMQNSVRISGNITPIPVVWWLNFYFDNCKIQETVISGVSPQLHIANSRVSKSSFFFYYSPQFNEQGSKYIREIIRINFGLFSNVGLRMTSNLDRVTFQDLKFTDANRQRANNKFLYDYYQTVVNRTIHKNDASQALFYEKLDADYNKEYIEIAQQLENPIDLTATIAVDNAAPNVGEQIILSLTADNIGANTATETIANTQIPAGFTYVTDDANGGYDNATGTWTIGEMASGTNQILNITLTADTAGEKEVSTNVSAKENEINPVDNTASVIITPVTPA